MLRKIDDFLLEKIPGYQKISTWFEITTGKSKGILQMASCAILLLSMVLAHSATLEEARDTFDYIFYILALLFYTGIVMHERYMLDKRRLRADTEFDLLLRMGCITLLLLDAFLLIATGPVDARPGMENVYIVFETLEEIAFTSLFYFWATESLPPAERKRLKESKKQKTSERFAKHSTA